MTPQTQRELIQYISRMKDGESYFWIHEFGDKAEKIREQIKILIDTSVISSMNLCISFSQDGKMFKCGRMPIDRGYFYFKGQNLDLK